MRLLTVISFYLFACISFGYSQSIDSLIQSYQNSRIQNDKQNQFITGEKIINHFYLNQDFKNQLKYLNQLIDESYKTDDQIYQCKFLLKRAQVYESGILYQKSLNDYNKLNNDKQQCINLHSLREKISKIYTQLGKTDSAVSYLKLNLENDNNDYNYELRQLQNIAELYLQDKDYESAINTYKSISDIIHNQELENEKYVMLNNLGRIYYNASDPNRAISNFNNALKIAKQDHIKDLPLLYYNIAISNRSLGKNEPAIKNLYKAIDESHPDKTLQAQIHALLTDIYIKTEEVYKAGKHVLSTISNAKIADEADILKDAYLEAALINIDLFDYENALKYYNLHLNTRDSIDLISTQVRQKDLKANTKLKEAESEIKLFEIDKKLQEERIQKLESEKEALALKEDAQTKRLELAQSQSAVIREQLRVQQLDSIKTAQELLLRQDQLLAAQQKATLIELEFEKNNIEIAKQKQIDSIAIEQQKSENQRLAIEQDNIAKQFEIDKNKIEFERQKTFKKLVQAIAALGSLLFLFTLFGVFKLRQSNNIVRSERRKSDRLLSSILPTELAEELKTQGSAAPKSYEMVTVLFTDFTGFSSISQQLNPEALIEELEVCFLAFDEIIEKYGIEKIKTIGDSYMCAGGIPSPNKTNPHDCIQAAIEMQKFMQHRYKIKTSKGDPYWKMRVGIHTGPVVAGVVGKNKFAYDIWGDTVNIASRMEQAADASMINITKTTYEKIKDNFDIKYRGEIAVKNNISFEMYAVKY